MFPKVDARGHVFCEFDACSRVFFDTCVDVDTPKFSSDAEIFSFVKFSSDAEIFKFC